MQLYEHTVSETVKMIQSKEVKCSEVFSSYIDRIKEIDPKVNAFLTYSYEDEMKKAIALDEKIAKGEKVGSLCGVPYALKDNICTKDIRTTCSSKLLENFIPPYSAHVYENLMRSDALLLGKVDMDEFAMGGTNENSAFNTVRNPFDLNKVPGGSSGASAVSVSAEMSCFALGSDTGGSVRNPAAFCNLTGFKPTYGEVSRYGLIAFASSLDQIGTLTRDVEDCARVMNVISGHDERDTTSLEREKVNYLDFIKEGIKGMKIGVDMDCVKEGVSEDIIKAYENTIDTFKQLGAEIVNVNFKYLKYVVPVYYLVACSEASSNLARFDGIRYGKRSDDAQNLIDTYILSRSEGFGDEVKKRIMLGTYALSAGYYDMFYNKALKVRRIIKDDIYRVLGDCDVYLSPTTPQTAFKLGEKVDDELSLYAADLFTATANLAGLPAISIPAGFDKDNMPIGMQLYAKGLNEEAIIRTAYNFQLSTNFHKVKPPIK